MKIKATKIFVGTLIEKKYFENQNLIITQNMPFLNPKRL
jgi:hypothetical protein